MPLSVEYRATRSFDFPSEPAPASRAHAIRRELGLPTDRPIVMSGHQSEFWHPGILAKWFAAARLAERAGAAPVWLEVDQDSNTPWRVHYPAAGPARAAFSFLSGPEPPVDTPTGLLPPLRPRDPASADPSPGFDFARDGLRAMHRALAAHEDVPTLAAQLAAARDDLLTPFGPLPRTVFATALARTVLFAEAVDAMRRDPPACVEAFNRAAAAHPRARVRALAMTTARVELPLWRVQAGRPREPVFSDELGGIPQAELAPRALLMTAVVRAGACDLFIHGLGGEMYDLVTEDWMRGWLGWTLAPTAVVSATLHLPFDTGDVPRPEEVAAATWTAHRARHDPGMLGDATGDARKRELVAAIDAAESRPERAALFRDLHAVTAGARAIYAAELAELDRRAAELRVRGVRADVIFDRTWAFPLYPREFLANLRDRVGTSVDDGPR
ncbi:MAG: hypothetical protein HBSAPP03_24370 [Phycisphaerae bacterium]|nr:MAG: hypothetical protein HBSAPP03_24370 [Phycisphaerae bacterium]